MPIALYSPEVTMSKSPGHQQHPDHKIEEKPFPQKMMVEVDGNVVAESSNVIRVDEDKHPARYYFPRSDVRMDMLERSDTTTQCPFKGTAHYFNLKLKDRKIGDAVWTYEDPYDEHKGLKDRLAFYDEKNPEIRVKAA
jgi:uncharacterized protein (DUF427 family)